VEYEDRTLPCADCGNQFTFSASDQEFHASRGYQDPKRCPDCRQSRRAERGGGGGGGGDARTMYDAVCANCGVETQVPFEPRQNRPVYCSDCFAKVKPSRPSW
jgi:CxxC-x17-CxxC domain-containing protein